RTLLEKMSADTTVVSDLLRDSVALEHIAADARTVFRITPREDVFDIEALVRPVKGATLTSEPGHGQPTVALTLEGRAVQIERDLEKEKANWAAMEEKLAFLEDGRTSDRAWTCDVGNCLQLLLVVRDSPELSALEWPQGEPFRLTQHTIDLDGLRLSARCMGAWFEMEGSVALDKNRVLSIAQILECLRDSPDGFIRINDKEFVALSSALAARLAALNEAVGKKPGRTKKDAVHMSVFKAPVLDALEGDGFTIDADKATRELQSRIAESRESTPAVPAGLAAELRDYQTEGYAWLMRLAAWGAGAILADDMGLGKTVQAIALLAARAKAGPQLVVMPTAVLNNWEAELARFAPGLRVRVLNREDREELTRTLEAGDVVLSTYGVLAIEIERLKAVDWQSVVLDEAHTVKNRTTKTSKAVMQLSAQCRVLLTGTPLQNRLSEIWNLFEFANPGLLGSYDDFVEHFITPVEVHHSKTVQRRLKRLVAPFILRRTKAEVLDELPEKTELTIRVPLTDDERALYETLRQSASNRLESGEINPIQALAELTRLRLAACHPKLVNPALTFASSKTAAFLDLAAELIESGHRALVFSQFTSHLALIRPELEKRGIPHLYLDGGMSAATRAELVKAFQQGDAPLFLISLKAGGTGLNLTAADYVIHLDPWWNPAIENQASDRAYRIGQERPVTIYRLIAEGTIEEKILRLHETKKSLADALLEGTDMSARLSRDEILALLTDQ
ncbi:MAG: DEAD/DEAH box helicase, partial [Duodenibacillus sp.]